MRMTAGRFRRLIVETASSGLMFAQPSDEFIDLMGQIVNGDWNGVCWHSAHQGTGIYRNPYITALQDLTGEHHVYDIARALGVRIGDISMPGIMRYVDGDGGGWSSVVFTWDPVVGEPLLYASDGEWTHVTMDVVRAAARGDVDALTIGT